MLIFANYHQPLNTRYPCIKFTAGDKFIHISFSFILSSLKRRFSFNSSTFFYKFLSTSHMTYSRCDQFINPHYFKVFNPKFLFIKLFSFPYKLFHSCKLMYSSLQHGKKHINGTKKLIELWIFL